LFFLPSFLNKVKNILSKTLITGAEGMIGSYVDFGIRLTHKQLDITNEKNVLKTIKKYRPRAIIHLAAATDLEQCEKNPDYAYRVNSLGTYYLALAAREVNAKLVYISTNSVFDGLQSKPYQVSDIPNPKNTYGRSKYLGELAIRGILKNYTIIRTCWIFGGGRGKDKKLVGKIMAKIEQGMTKLQATDDHFGSPTYAKDLIEGIKRLLIDDAKGIFHIVNKGMCSRAEEVGEIIKIKGVNVIINPVPAKTFGFSSDRLHEALKPSPSFLRTWQEALKEYIISEWQ
jgi:dTDP-4-dehydrorhamnose reductase